jgi:hypothetical protein
MDDAWHVAFSAESLPRSQDTRSPAETALLHEVIIQAVTEWKVARDPIQSYETQLTDVVSRVTSSAGYKALLQRSSFELADVTTLLEEANLPKLPVNAASDQQTFMMVTGGPATGKSELARKLRENFPAIYEDAAQINPDDYKLLLASRDKYGQAYADVAHGESSQLTDEILARLQQKIDAGHAPDVVMDVVSPNERRMQLANQAGHLVVITGTVPPEEALNRAYERGLPANGRRVPTEIVLEGAKKVAQATPKIFEHHHLGMELYDTSGPAGAAAKNVAHWNQATSTLEVKNPDVFIDFVERQNLNQKATGADQLFQPGDRTPERIAQGLAAYTDRGVKLAFLDGQGQLALTLGKDGAEQIRPLSSQRGASFFPELLVAAGATIVRKTAQKDTPEPESSPAEKHTENRSASSETLHSRVGSMNNGIGVGLGLRGLYHDVFDDQSTLKHDLAAGGAQAVAGGARFLTQATDVVISVAATVEGTLRTLEKPAAQAAVSLEAKLAELGPLPKLAGKAALPLAIGAGLLEAGAGALEHDAERVASAVGNTAGGIVGGMAAGAVAGAAWGFVGGSPTGPGAIITAGAGALVGAIGGGYVGDVAAKHFLTGTVDKILDAVEPRKPPLAGLSPEMMRALESAKSTTLSADIRLHDGGISNAGLASTPARLPSIVQR